MTRPTAPCPLYGMPCEYVPLAHEAEALRAEVEEYRDEFLLLSSDLARALLDNEALRAENARLREALEQLSRYTANENEMDWDNAVSEMNAIARAALTPPEKENADGE